ncbi:MAG: hypothetical protein AAF127_01440 [Pseudomonadota bacterium]
MTTATIVTSKPDQWNCPRPYTDASLRYRKYGPTYPMEEPSLIERLFGGAR